MSVVEAERTSALETQARVAGDQVRAEKVKTKALTKQVKELEAQADIDAVEIDKVDVLKETVKVTKKALDVCRKANEDLSKEVITQTQVADAGRAVAAAMKVLGA